MPTATRENQTGLIRDSNDTGASFNEAAVDDFLTAYQLERQRIKREREAENEAREKEARSKSFPESFDSAIDTANDFLAGQIRDKILGGYLAPLADVLELAEENRLRVQNFIAPEVKQDSCGISIESPLINYTFLSPDCRQQEGTSTEPKPFTPPPPSPFFNNNSDTYRELFNSANVGKTFTLLWKYEGWVSDVFIKPSSSSGLISWSGLTDTQANALVGANVINIIRFIPGNPISGLQPIGSFPNGNPLPWRVYADNRVSAGNFAEVIYPQQFPFTINNIGTHARYGYRSTAKVLAVQKFNTSNGVRNFFNLRINIRTDISIGAGGFPSYTSGWDSSTNSYRGLVDDFYLMQFFRMAYSNLPNDEFPLQIANLTDPEIVGYPTVPGFKKPLPPPPPPRKKCDCMSNCCPQNQTDLSELKRLLRMILDEFKKLPKSSYDDLAKLIGKPKQVVLFDEDLNKQGAQRKKVTPDTAFEHLALLSDRIEVALRIIGITDLPIEVDEHRSAYPESGKLFAQSKDPAIKDLGKEMLKNDRRKITTVLQALDWYGDAIDEKLGGWESKISLDDIDLVKEGNQEATFYHTDIQHALHDTMKYAFQGGLYSESTLQLIAKSLAEMAVLKKEIVGQTYKLDLLIDWLGMGYTETAEQLPVPVNFSPEAMQSLGEKKLGPFLTSTELPINRPVLEAGGATFNARLTELESAVSTVQAAHRFPVPSIQTIRDLLKLLDGKKDWDDFIKTQQQFVIDNELQLDIEDITGDKEKMA